VDNRPNLWTTGLGLWTAGGNRHAGTPRTSQRVSDSSPILGRMTMTGLPQAPPVAPTDDRRGGQDLLHISSSTLQTWRDRGLIDGHQLADGRSWRYPSRQPAIQDALAAAYALRRGHPVMEIAEPLPECPGCSRPVKRETADRTGGVCSKCLPLFPEAFAKAQAAADRERLERQAAAIRHAIRAEQRAEAAARRRQGSVHRGPAR
jgi:hypothetical protein